MVRCRHVYIHFFSISIYISNACGVSYAIKSRYFPKLNVNIRGVERRWAKRQTLYAGSSGCHRALELALLLGLLRNRQGPFVLQSVEEFFAVCVPNLVDLIELAKV